MLVMSRTVMTFIIFLPTFFIYLSVPLSSLILHHCFHWTCFAQIRLQLKQVYFAAFICIHEWLHLLLVFLLALPLSFIIFTIPLMSWCFSLWQRQSLKKKKERKSIIICLALYMLSINWIQNWAWNKNAFLFPQWKEILHLHKMSIATSGGQTHVKWVVLIFSKFSKSKVSK